MAHKKTIAIIGATGNVGSAIAKRFSSTNYRLLLVSDEPEQLNALEAQLNECSVKAEVESLTCEREASWEADIIIVAAPAKQGKEIAEKIREVAIGKIVVSISQPANGQRNIAGSGSASHAEELQQLLPYSKIVKTYHTALALDQQACKTNCNDADAFIAGNNGAAVDTVAELVKNAGLNPVPVGDLSASRVVEKIGHPVSGKSNWREWWNSFAFVTAIFADLV